MSSNDAIFKAVFSVLVFPNLVGNSLVILVILKSRSLRTPMNYLLLNLAVADLMMGVSMFPRFILSDTFVHPRGRAGDVLCKIVMAGNLGWIGAISSIFSLVLISLERYYVIMKPLSIRHRITTKKLKTLVPISWTAAVIFVIPIFYISHFDEDLGMCNHTWSAAWLAHSYDFLWLLVAGILPTSIMLALYSRVAYFLWFESNHAGDNVTLQAVRRSRKKVTITMLTLSTVYALSWLPDLLMHVISNALPKQFSLDHPAHTVAIYLVVVNSSVNPVVYAFRFEQFKRELIKIICCARKYFDNRVLPSNTEQYDTATRQPELEMNTRDAGVHVVTTEPE